MKNLVTLLLLLGGFTLIGIGFYEFYMLFSVLKGCHP